jgi:hypothetical protein
LFGGICILFDDVKEAVTTKEAAESYGVSVNRAGMACCIFHNDHTPSMKVDVRFHCFGCGADGDVIDFTARLFDLSPKAAAEKLAADFNIAYDGQTPKQPCPKASSVTAKRSLMQRLKNDQNGKYRVLCSYLHLLENWQEQYAPQQTDEEWHPLYTEALQNIDRVNYLLDELQGCTANEAQEILSGCKNEIARYAARVREFKPRHSRNKQEPVR